MQLNFNILFSDLYSRSGLIKLDRVFLHYIKSYDKVLFNLLIESRKNKIGNSQIIIDLSYLLDEFIAKLFNIEKEVDALKKRHNNFTVIYKCKRLFVQRYALKKYANTAIDINYVISKLNHLFSLPITEQTFAEQVMYWFENREDYQYEIELAAQYAAWRVENKSNILFSTYKKINHENLVSCSEKETGTDKVKVLYSDEIKRRYGFDLTSKKPRLNEALDNAHYCIFCHKQNKDSCSKGLIENGDSFKKSPLKVELHGCPLAQKISEMNLIKSEGYSIASLAIIMIDNPLCAATGHRICNDCMNSCIYQKQEPVNIPMIESKILDDVLNLPYGFEVYSLLSRWNPLNFQRPFPKAETGKNILVVGLGPAGFNLSHHLLNDGHNIIAIDGLKIEPLLDDFQPIRDFKYEKLSERIASGFGGVAEYGITSRWDKNYLKIIRLLLERRKNFAIYGGIRFGGTITVDDTFDLGFDHIALAIGSGKPKMIKIRNMLANMASDFLMSLQLTGAMNFNSVTNLQVRMPIVIIGGGLTAIDTATEAMAYYPIQIEKFLSRYEVLVNKYGKDEVEKDWTKEEHEIANEFISHAKLIRQEYEIAKQNGRKPRILELMQNWGGVKIVYRKRLKDSPSYRVNSEEVQNALSEGVYFIENLEPIEIVADRYNNAEKLKLIDSISGKVKYIKARSIFIAAGSEPNTVIADEDKKHFKLKNGYFIHIDSAGREVEHIFSPKMSNKDRIFIYKKNDKAISFFGDMHPSYMGSVVRAMASAKNGYPIISRLLSMKKSRNNIGFFDKIKEQLTARVVKITYLTSKVVEIIIKAPIAAKNFQPGQFFRLQNFYRKNSLAMEGIAVTGAAVDLEKGIISTIVLETGGSTNLCKFLQEGEQVVLMGPTGSPTEF
ncbi:glutamate synthase subunit beta [Wolbachia pipientis]|uniref:Glutamate synthase subunit beta n=1 Tax=Wolbachia pipientis TaxID=955 RepID=A0A1E7QJA7_WOLPI|nr:FAD-dependent oxidoreductase [Wolbachia pipientis]OEY86550.1 glutamate synthase subunit beta [Wolbachia pipientis]